MKNGKNLKQKIFQKVDTPRDIDFSGIEEKLEELKELEKSILADLSSLNF